MKKYIFILILFSIFNNISIKGQTGISNWFISPYRRLYVSTPYIAYWRHFIIYPFSGNYFDADYISKHKIYNYYYIRITEDTLMHELTTEEVLNYTPKKKYITTDTNKIIFCPDENIKLVDYFILSDMNITCDSVKGLDENEFIKKRNRNHYDMANWEIKKIDTAEIVWFGYFYEYRDSLVHKKLPDNRDMYIYHIPFYESSGYYQKEIYMFIYMNKDNLPEEYVSFYEEPYRKTNELHRTYVKYDRKGRITKVTDIGVEFSFRREYMQVNKKEPKVKELRIKYGKNNVFVYENDTLIYRKIAKKNYILIETINRKNLIIFKTNKRKLPVKTLFYEIHGFYNDEGDWDYGCVVNVDTFFIQPPK